MGRRPINSAQKRRFAALLPRRPGKKGKEGGGKRGGGAGPVSAVFTASCCQLLRLPTVSCSASWDTHLYLWTAPVRWRVNRSRINRLL